MNLNINRASFYPQVQGRCVDLESLAQATVFIWQEAGNGPLWKTSKQLHCTAGMKNRIKSRMFHCATAIWQEDKGRCSSEKLKWCLW